MEQVDRQYAFHRLAHSWPQHRWWKPLVTGLIGLIFYLAFTIALVLIAAVIALASSADVEPYLDAAAAIDLGDPVIFAFVLFSLIIMIPALVLATLIMGPRPVGLLSSVMGRLRWRWLGLCTLVAVGIYAASLALSSVIGALFPSDAAPIAQPDAATMIILLALTLLAVPFQAAAEEYVFRGYLMQLVGSWLKHPAFAILLPVPLFVLGHGYDPLGQTDIAIFAIFAGWITWRTGGLEAAIAVHAINNMTIFALGAVGLADVNATEGSVGGLVVSIATMGITAFVIVRLADRRGIERTRAVAPALTAPAVPGPGWPGTTTFPAGDGVWHRSPQQQAPTTGQFGGWHAPPQHTRSTGGTRPYEPVPYDPNQYEQAHYEKSDHQQPSHQQPTYQQSHHQQPDHSQPTRDRPSHESGAANGSSAVRRADPATTPTPTQTPTPTPTPGANSVDLLPAPTPAPRTPAPQSHSRAAGGGPERTSVSRSAGFPTGEGFPSGPGFPTGQGFPTGPGFPTGQGFPGAQQLDGHGDQAKQSGAHEDGPAKTQP